jgi:hypothetical protein
MMTTFLRWLLLAARPLYAIQYSVAVNNAQLDSKETTIGTAPMMRLFTGSMPANCAASSTGTKLTEDLLPSDWMNDAASASKTKKGTWTLNGVAAGTAGYFRVFDTTGTTCHMQGTVTATGGGGDMTLDNTSIASSQVVTVNTFTINSGNT